MPRQNFAFVAADTDEARAALARLQKRYPPVAPERAEVSVKVGEETLAFYRATNVGSAPITGTATFNVVPEKAGPYFSKIDCFCFREQTLAPGESAELPVSFFVDPAIAEERGLDDVTVITLSYTFFASQRPTRVSNVSR